MGATRAANVCAERVRRRVRQGEPTGPAAPFPDPDVALGYRVRLDGFVRGETRADVTSCAPPPPASGRGRSYR